MIFGDLGGLPPILLQVSNIEMLHSDSTRIARLMKDAGVDVTLQEFDGMLHAFPATGTGLGIPEIEEALENITVFIRKVRGDS